MNWKNIKLNVEDNIALLTLSRPEKMNALTAEMIHEFVDVLDQCDSDDEVKAVIVTGDGRAFCAGADISGGSESFADVSNDDARNTDGSVNYSSEAVRDGGLISKICSPETLLECAHTIARNIVDNTSPVSIALTRQMLWKSLGWDHPMDAHKLESRGVFSRSTSADAQEGVASFLEKRPAKYPQSVAKDMPDFYPWWEPEKYC